MPTKDWVYDERDLAVANLGFRIGFFFLLFALPIAAFVRFYAFGQHSWDLIAMYWLSLIPAIYLQQKRKSYTGPKRWVWYLAWSGALTLVAAFNFTGWIG